MLWGTNQPHISPTGSGEAAEPWHTHTHTHTFDQFLTQFWIKLITLTCWHTNDTHFWSSSVECPPSALLSVKEVWAAPRSGLMWATHTELPGVLLSYRCVEKHTHTHTHTPQLDQTTYLPCLCVCVCVCVCVCPGAGRPGAMINTHVASNGTVGEVKWAGGPWLSSASSDFHQEKLKTSIKKLRQRWIPEIVPVQRLPSSYRHVIARQQQRGPNNSGRLRVEEEKRLRLSTYPAPAAARVRKKVLEARREAAAQGAKSRSESAALGSVMKLCWCVCCVCVCEDQKSSGLADGTGPPKNTHSLTHTLTQ